MKIVAARIALLATLAGSAACAGSIARPHTSPSPPAADALLILPGFGYGRDGERSLRALPRPMREAGVDLYVPAYVDRSGLEDSRSRLRRFILEQRLDRYARVHVFAFLAGGWTLNPLLEDAEVLPNLATLIYDRSPYQERAPRIAADRLRLLAWLRYGRVLFDLAREPYAPLGRRGVRVGILVETVPTGFVKRFAAAARAYGPFTFDCGSFAQPYDDCMFVPLSHDELYTRFAGVWPDVHAFIQHGRFRSAADRTAPVGDILSAGRHVQEGR